MTRSGLARLLGAYLFHRKRLWFWTLFAVLLAAYTVNIKLAVELNDWNGRFYDALQRVDKDAIYRELVFFIGLAAVIIALLVSAGYLKDRVIIALRRDITYVFFDRWLSPASAHYLLRESGKEPDNPDQRMSEDVKNLVSLSLNLSVSLFDSLLTIGSFSVILWTLSGSAEVFGITVPGYMFWVCLIYTAFSTWLTHVIGRKLKTYNIGVQHKEADLRAALMEKRRHADAIAGARGEATEAVGLHEKFGSLMDMLINLVKKQRDLDFFTVGLGQFTHLAPIFFSLPAFLAGHIQLGGLMQIRGAFGDVARSLSWIIFCYDDLAKLSAAYARLKRLEAGLTEAETLRKRLLPVQSGAGQNLTADLQLTVPGHSSDAARKLSVKLTLKPGTLTLLTGTSGIGKSTLMKTLAGFYAGFEGLLTIPDGVYWIPQRGYIFTGTLRANLAYPRRPETLTDREAQERLTAVGLESLLPELDTQQDWSVRLSGGEQQRLCLIRCLAVKPKVLLLDESLSGLEDTAAEALLTLVRRALPDTAVLLITHQSGLISRADTVLTLT